MFRFDDLGELLRYPQFFQLIPVKIPGLWRTALGTDHAVDLPDDDSLEAANNFLFRQPFCGAPSDVGFGALVVAHPHKSNPIQCRVRTPVTTTIKPVPVGSPRACQHWSHPTQVRQRCFGMDTLRIISNADQKITGHKSPKSSMHCRWA